MEYSNGIIKILLFAIAKETVGQDRIELPIALPTNVGLVKEALASNHQNMAPLIANSRLAVNRSFADDSQVIHGDEEIALIPPVSGG